MSDYNVIIVGGGVVGLTLAAMLAESSLKILLIDQQDAPVNGLSKPSDIRVSAINHASLAIFQSIDVWQSIKNLRVSPYDKMQVWDADGNAKIDFAATEVGQTFLGHIIEHNVMRQVLWQKLLEKKNVNLRSNCKILQLNESDAEVSVTLDGEEVFSTKLLVGADGGHSWVAKHAALSIKTKPYNQSALVATIHTEKSHQQTCFERFMPNGPLAFLPLLDPHQVSIVWSTQTSNAKKLQTIDADAFNIALAKESEHVLGKVKVLSSREVFPLIARHATHYVKPRIALVGDAAHTIHPLAGQGVNLGLLDAACLAQVVEEAHQSERDIGTFYNLRRYERWRKGDNTIMLAAMQGFKQLFTSTLPLLSQLRAFGFKLAKTLPFAKPFFMHRAMGLHGDLPKRAVFWADF